MQPKDKNEEEVELMRAAFRASYPTRSPNAEEIRKVIREIFKREETYKAQAKQEVARIKEYWPNLEEAPPGLRSESEVEAVLREGDTLSILILTAIADYMQDKEGAEGVNPNALITAVSTLVWGATLALEGVPQEEEERWVQASLRSYSQMLANIQAALAQRAMGRLLGAIFGI